jgi:hypothetical protein
LKPRRPQPDAWNGVDGEAAAPWADVTSAPICFTEQSDGLRMKLGRSTTTVISRTRSGMPCQICGSGSDTAVTCAVRRSTRSAVLTAIGVRASGPRNGPASTGTFTSRP